MKFLKQNTSATIRFGPFVDKTDGVTAGGESVRTLLHARVRG